MPKADRARVASPPAGTALARAAWECLPSRVRQERGSILHVTLSVTIVNRAVTTTLRSNNNSRASCPALGSRLRRAQV